MKGKSMKKCMILMVGILMMASVVMAQSVVTCSNGQGILVKGINGKTYCRSKVTMNWWSAHAWCEAAQGFDKLINPTEDCDCTGVEGCDTTLSCPNLATDTATVWTNMVASSVYVYCLRMYSGSIERCHKQGVNSGGLLYALCK